MTTHNNSFTLHGQWRRIFQKHILTLEKFLSEQHVSLQLPDEQSVYLAGMLARQYDSNYRRQIRRYLFSQPEDLELLIRRHYAYMGQNAPVCFMARINAEYLTVRLLSYYRKKVKESLQTTPSTMNTDQLLPAHYFEVAARYAYQASKSTWSSIFSYIYINYAQVVSLLSAYMNFINKLQSTGTWEPTNGALGQKLWERFSHASNERNNQKELWERNRISPKEKTHIPRREFNQIMNFHSIN